MSTLFHLVLLSPSTQLPGQNLDLVTVVFLSFKMFTVHHYQSPYIRRYIMWILSVVKRFHKEQTKRQLRVEMKIHLHVLGT
jgi:hypothetical protein